MSQRLIVAIGISAVVGVLLLIALNLVTLLRGGPAASPGIGSRPTPSLIAAGSTAPSGSLTPATPSGGSFTPSATSGGPTATPGPTAVAGLAENESSGEISLRVDAPLDVRLTAAAVCAWARDVPLRVAEVRSAKGAALVVGGEQVSLVVKPDDHTAPLLLSRAGTGAKARAAYGITRAGPAGVAISGETDRHLGEAAFHGLGPVTDEIPPDQLPVRRTVYGQPLGNKANAKQITGGVSWQCGESPPGYQPGPAEPSPSPGAPAVPAESDRYPRITLTGAGGLTQAGVPWCGSTTASDGTAVTDTCASEWPAPADYPTALVVPRATRLQVTPQSGWKIASWSVRESTQSDVDTNGGKPKADILLFTGDRGGSPVTALFFRAPGTGTWIIRARLVADGPGQSDATTTWFFLVRAT